MIELSIELIREVFSYCPATGIIIWKNPINKKAITGKQAGYVWRHLRKEYLIVPFGRKQVKAHRLAWALYYGSFPKHQIDHVDNNGLNNKIENLRDVEQTINQKNRRINLNNKAGMAGVYYDKNCKKWRASIQSDKKRYNLGCFEYLQEAKEARQKANIKYGFCN